MGFSSGKSLLHLILVLNTQGVELFTLQTIEITVSYTVKETYEVIEDTTSEALLSDHNVAIKHFV